jgi:hypothetical protein
MRNHLVRLWEEFNFALDHFFPRRFKYVFYITMLLPYSTNLLAKIFYRFYPFETAYVLDIELYSLNILWVFLLVSYKITEMLKNEWIRKNK